MAPVVAILLAIALPGAGEFEVRVAGYLVTLLGVLLVAGGIVSTQQLFGRPTYRNRIRGWLKRFAPLFRRQQVVIGVGGSSLGISSASGSAIVRINPKNNSLSARLSAVEENLQRVEDRVTSTEHQLRREIDQARAALARQIQERERAEQQLAQKVEEYSTGGLDAELVGAVWVVIGQAFSSFPVEVANLLGLGR